MSDLHKSDQRAAFRGLILTAIALFLVAFGIAKWTNAQFAGHEASATEAAH